jgi:hypothetical protein
MKKVFAGMIFGVLVTLLAFCMMVLTTCPAFAVVEGTCTQSLAKYKTANPNLMILTFTCLGSDNDGDFPSISTTAAITSEIVGWYISEVRTYPGTKAPQNLWDVVINDSDSFDLMGGTLGDRSQAAQRAMPLWTTGLYASVPIYGTLALVITGTNVTVSTPIIKVFLIKDPALK